MRKRVPVTVIPTGVANLASVLAGFQRAGADPLIRSGPAAILEAARLVLPGVGSFGAAMKELTEQGVVAPLKERIKQGRPTLAICLGLQLLCEWSEESPGCPGLGIIPATAGRFHYEVRVPQMGWNRVEADANCRLLHSGCGYFANSYRLEMSPPGWAAAFAIHGGRFIAAMERESILACQFHPELSGKWGIDLMRRWLEFSGKEGRCC